MPFHPTIIANAQRVADRGKYLGMSTGEPLGIPCKKCGMELNVRVLATGGGTAECGRCKRDKEQEKNRKAPPYAYDPVKQRQSSRRFAELRPIRTIAQKINSRANATGIPCNLTDRHLHEIKTEQCPCCGQDMDYTVRTRQNGAELDRHIPELGYVEGNVSFLCRKCNNWKSNMTSADARMVLAYIEGLGV